MTKVLISILFIFMIPHLVSGAEKRAFVDSTTGVLKAWGYMEENQPGDQKITVPDDFKLDPGKWRWDGKQWVARVPPPQPPDPKIVDLKAKIDIALANPTIPQAIKDFLTSLKATLP